MGFIDSLGANAVLAAVYVVYKLLDRCLHSKCRYNRDGGLDFDLGDQSDAVQDLDKLAELIKSRSILHKQKISTAV